jgi:transketolase
MADLVAVLYGGVLRVGPDRVGCPDRDRFILSKGHGCAALYSALGERGFFPKEWLNEFYQDGAHLPGHATHAGVPGVEVSTGALGHGLSMACGMALAGKRDRRSYRVFVVLSDGECDEGSIWEAAMFASHHRLDNLTVIVDYNKLQSLKSTQETLDLEPFTSKWEAFGWSTMEVDGHDIGQLASTLACVPHATSRPTCLIAHTVKGKGVDFMENQVLWHYRPPNDGELQEALAALHSSNGKNGHAPPVTSRLDLN